MTDLSRRTKQCAHQGTAQGCERCHTPPAPPLICHAPEWEHYGWCCHYDLRMRIVLDCGSGSCILHWSNVNGYVCTCLLYNTYKLIYFQEFTKLPNNLGVISLISNHFTVMKFKNYKSLSAL